MKIFSAPLQGYTDCAWRNIHSRVFAGTIDCYYAPFLRLEKGAFRNKDLRDITPEVNSSYRLVPQVMACPREHFSVLVEKVASMGYREIDINMGCPFPPVVKRHCGAGVLPYPEEVKAMLAVLCEYPDVAFSIKMRLGVENCEEWRTLMPIIAAVNPVHVSLHPRTARQQYGGEINMEQFGRFYDEAPFPVVYNGDLRTGDDITSVSTRYPRLCAMMIGRGLLYNPALAYSGNDARHKIMEMHRLLFEYYRNHLCGDAHLLAKMKSLWEYFLAETGDRKCRKKILKSSSIEKYNAAVEEFWHSLNND